MKRKRKLTFEKVWKDNSTGGSSVATDSWIMHCIFEAAEYSHMEIMQIKLSNLYTCKVIVKATKMEFQSFVHRVIDRLKDNIKEINF